MNIGRAFWIASIIIAISLLSTVVALSVQRLFGLSAPLTLVGPFVAVVAVLLVVRYGWGKTTK